MTDRKYHDETEAYFVSIGLMPPKEERTETWVLHHPDEEMIRRDPERHDKYLIEDVVPMPISEHFRHHNLGEKSHFYGEDHSGENNGFYGKTQSEEVKQRMRTNNPMFNEESLKSMVEKRKGIKWFNNGIENCQAFECPEGFVPGRLKFDAGGWYNNGIENTRAKSCPPGFVPGRLSFKCPKAKGKHWFNNGVESYQAFECPEGFIPGRIYRRKK